MSPALSQEGAAAHRPAHTVIQHMRNTKPGTACAAPQRQETWGRISEATRENMQRENSTGGEDQRSVYAENEGIQEMEDSGRKPGFVRSITQEQFLLLDHVSNFSQE